jgi:hypothetical protein
MVRITTKPIVLKKHESYYYMIRKPNKKKASQHVLENFDNNGSKEGNFNGTMEKESDEVTITVEKPNSDNQPIDVDSQSPNLTSGVVSDDALNSNVPLDNIPDSSVTKDVSAPENLYINEETSADSLKYVSETGILKYSNH